MKIKLLSLGLCALAFIACNSKNNEKEGESAAEKTYELVWTDSLTRQDYQMQTSGF